MPTTLRPIHWLGAGHHDVNHHIGFGRQSVQAGLNHLAIDWGTSNTPDASVYNACRPNRFVWRELKPGSSLPIAPLHRHLNYLFEFDQPSIPVAFMSSSDLVSWWSMLIKPDEVSSGEFSALLSQPEFLVQFGFHRLKNDFSWVSEEVSEIAACLSMVGVGAIEILLAETCDLCGLRRSAPACRRCDQCSRSKRLFDTGDRGSQSARSMRNKRIQALSGLPIKPISDDLQASFSRSMASLLFIAERETTPCQVLLQGVRISLDAAPLVRAMLPFNFFEMSSTTQLETLRNIIDPNEWDYDSWPAKILRFQAFTEALETLTRRRRTDGRPLQRTTDLAHRARALLSQGLSKSEVAFQLSISRSHLSHTLKRTSKLADL